MLIPFVKPRQVLPRQVLSYLDVAIAKIRKTCEYFVYFRDHVLSVKLAKIGRMNIWSV